MGDRDKQKTEMRRQAERRLQIRHGDSLKLPPERLPSLIHELEVHQIELEMQNEELQRSSLEAEAARDRYADLFDLAPVGYLILDISGHIRQVNLAGAEMLGLRGAQLLNFEFFKFVAREYQDTLYQHLRQVFKNQTRQSCEVGLELFDGSGLFVKLDSVVHPEVAGDIPRCLTLVSDISALKKAQTVSRQAREAAEQANRAKSHFLAAASHDLRQPLQVMTTIVDLLKIKLNDETALELVDMLSKSLFNLNELLNTLLNLSQLESGSITAKSKEFPVDDLLQRLDATYRPLAENKGLSLRVARSSAIIRSDPVLLGQILDNLVSNAIRYTEAGKVLLGCRHHGAMLRLEVWDTGIGVPEGMHRTIFKDYYQLDNPARDQNNGSGLGLAIAARSAHLLGQQIELKSWPNGSMFSVEVPLAVCKRGNEKTLASDASMSITTPATSLLVVDDNKIVLLSLTHLLESYGYKVTGVTNGQEALSRIKGAERFDLIITDYRLPKGETGFELIKTIRQASGMDIPALIITGDPEVATTHEIVSSGIRVLEKPAYAELMNKHIQEMLS